MCNMNISSIPTVFTILTLGIFSCNSTSPMGHEEKACTQYFLNEFNMDPYNGEELGCKTHIRLYEFENTMFALKINHCADFAPFTIYDCDGEEFCFTSLGPCHIQESIDYGIIGIYK